jgi:imidazolonepropionase-like amidohydrolase
MNQHLDTIDSQIAAKHLLTHPFYLAWTRGELSKDALADYTRQYYHHVAAFPTYLSAVHARCEDQATRKHLLSNLIDEEAGTPNHPELWLQFAEGLGMRREIEHATGVMKELKRRGVRVLPGGDYGFAWNKIGTNARDLEHFVNLFGFTPMEAIVAATRLGGAIMMKEGELGQIKPGFLADILLVDGNPLTDVRILQDRDRLLAIMKDGSFHKDWKGERKTARVAAE